MSRSKILVVVVSWNNFVETELSVRSVLDQTYVNFEIALIDNGSKREYVEPLRKVFGSHSQVHWVENEDNIGFTKAVNQALKLFVLGKDDYEYIAFLNNDAFADPKWLNSMIQVSRDNDAPLVAARMIQHRNQDRMESAGIGMLNTGEVIPDGYDLPLKDRDVVGPCFGVSGGAALYRVDVFDQLGEFDQDFPMGYDDAEFALRAFNQGIVTYYAPEAMVSHIGSLSLNKIKSAQSLIDTQYQIQSAYFLHAPFLAYVHSLVWSLVRAVYLLFFGQWRVLWIMMKASWRLFLNRKSLLKKRKLNQKNRVISTWKFLRSQRHVLVSDFSRWRLQKKYKRNNYYS